MRTLFLNLRSVESFQEILELQEVVCKIVMAPLCILLGSIPTAFIRDLKGSVGFTLHTLLSKKKKMVATLVVVTLVWWREAIK